VYAQLQSQGPSSFASAGGVEATATSTLSSAASSRQDGGNADMVEIEMEDMAPFDAAAGQACSSIDATRQCMCGGVAVAKCFGCNAYYCAEERCWNWSHSGLHPSDVVYHQAALILANTGVASAGSNFDE